MNKIPRRITSNMLFDNTFQDLFNVFDSAPAFGTGKNIPAYPHFNLSNVDDDGIYTIEVALAGFERDDISVNFEPHTQVPNSGVKVLKIEATQNDTNDNPKDYIHNGIANRNAKLSLLTHKDDTVKSCTYLNGILTIILLKVKPDNEIERIDVL